MRKKRQLKDLIDDFINQLKGQNYSEHTIKNYRIDLKQFEQFCNEIELDIEDLKRDEVREFLVELYHIGYKATTVSRKIASLKSFVNYLLKEKILNQDPILLIESPKKEKKLPNFIFQKEIDELLKNRDSDNIRDYCIFEVLYSTGLRVSELSNIKLKDIDFMNSNIKVLGKGKTERLVFLSPSTVMRMKEYLQSRINDSENYLFLSQKGKKLSPASIWHIIKNMSKKLKLNKDISPHTLRHSFASHLLDNGADIRSVQKLLGHKDLSTTQIYTHISKEKLKKVYESCHPHAG